MKCTKCGFENDERAKFCNWCGEKIEAEEVKETEKKCVICGNVNTADAKYCAVCGSQLSTSITTSFQETNQSTEHIYAETEDKFGTSSMVVGIVAIATTVLCCMFPLGLFGGIASLVFGIISTKRQGKCSGKALAGIICGVAALVIGLIITISVIVALNDPEFLEELKKAMEQSGSYY